MMVQVTVGMLKAFVGGSIIPWPIADGCRAQPRDTVSANKRSRRALMMSLCSSRCVFDIGF